MHKISSRVVCVINGNPCILCILSTRDFTIRRRDGNENAHTNKQTNKQTWCEISLRSVRLEVVGERENGRARGRHARG